MARRSSAASRTRGEYEPRRRRRPTPGTGRCAHGPRVARRRSALRSPPRSRPCSSRAPRSPRAPASIWCGPMDEDAAAPRPPQLTGSPPRSRDRARRPPRKRLRPRRAASRAARRPRRLRPEPTPAGARGRGRTRARGARRRRPQAAAEPLPSTAAAQAADRGRARRAAAPAAPSNVLPPAAAARRSKPAASKPRRRRSRRRRRSGSSSARPRRRRRPRGRDRAGRRADDLAQPRTAGSDAGVRTAAARLRQAARRDLEGARRRLGRRPRRPPCAGRARRGSGVRLAGSTALAARMAGTDAWKGALALSGRTGFADRAAASPTSTASSASRRSSTATPRPSSGSPEKVLSTPGILIYGGGRTDIMMGRIDVRVVVLIGYLAERHGAITVSSLFSGHRTFARPGVVSAHVYGHAVDIAAVGGTPIAGHQQPGGLTEAAVRSVLLLPGELQPQQVISLLGLGGPSFPLRDHGDHIHVGFWADEPDPRGRARRLRAPARGGAPAPADARPARPCRAAVRRGDPPPPGRLGAHVLHALPDRRRLPRPRPGRRRDRALARARGRPPAAAAPRPSSSSPPASASAEASRSATA